MMFAALVRFILVICFRILEVVILAVLGGVISLVRALSPLVFRLCVFVTGWVLALMDFHLDGRLTKSRAYPVLTAGGMWAVVGLLIPLIITLVMRWRFGLLGFGFCAIGFIFGLVCGFQATEQADWGWWLDKDRMEIGEVI